MRKGHANCIVSKYTIKPSESLKSLKTISLDVSLPDCTLILIVYQETMEKSCIESRRAVISHVHSFRSPVYLPLAMGRVFLKQFGLGARFAGVQNSSKYSS